ncbi:MAG: MaoC/PaaZ C-terminal domain-containing protein [Anaerolineae bacterium]|jgi:acyl dehydratase
MTETKDLNVRTSMYFEEFEVGQTVMSAGRTITESDIVGFAALSGDWNAIHTDAEYAAAHPFGQRVAHGLLVLSIATGLANRLGFMEESVLAFREIGSWKFSLPTYIGDTIRVRASVTETRPMRRLGGGLVTFKVELLNQDDQIVQRGTWGVLVKSGEGQG